MKIKKQFSLVNQHNQCLTYTYFEKNDQKNLGLNGTCYETHKTNWKDLYCFKNAKNLRKEFLNGKIFTRIECGLMTVFGEPTSPYIFQKITNNWGKKIYKWLIENYKKFGGNVFLISEKLTTRDRNLINIFLFGKTTL